MSQRCSVCQGCKCNLGLEDVHTGYCECPACGGCSCNLQDLQVNRMLLAYCRCTKYDGCMCMSIYGVLPAHEVRDPVDQDRNRAQENPNYQEDAGQGQQLPPQPPGPWFQQQQARTINPGGRTQGPYQDGSPSRGCTTHVSRTQQRLALPPPVNRERQPNYQQNHNYQQEPNYQEAPNYQEDASQGQQLPPQPPGHWFQQQARTINPGGRTQGPYQDGLPSRGSTIHVSRTQERLALPPPSPSSTNYRHERQQPNHSNQVPSNQVPSNNQISVDKYTCEQCNGCLCNRISYIKNSIYCSCESRGDCFCDQGTPPSPYSNYYQCPECNFPADLCPPIQNEEVVVPLEAPKFDCVWYYYCGRCSFPRNQVPPWITAQQCEMPVPERMFRTPPPPPQYGPESYDQEGTPSGRPPMRSRESHLASRSRAWGGRPQAKWNSPEPEATRNQQATTQQQAPRNSYSRGYRQHQDAPHSYREGAYRPGNQVSQPPPRVPEDPQPPRVVNRAPPPQQQQTPQRSPASKSNSPYRSIG